MPIPVVAELGMNPSSGHSILYEASGERTAASTYARLQYLAKLGMHGDSAPEVARFLISEGLTRLWMEGKIPDKQN